MIFEIDNREPEKLKKVISENVKNENVKNENSNNEKLNYEVVTKNLELGDFVLRNSENNILVIISRSVLCTLRLFFGVVYKAARTPVPCGFFC